MTTLQKLAKELYKSGLTDAEDFFTSYEGLDEEQQERFIRLAKLVMSRDIEVSIAQLKIITKIPEPRQYALDTIEELQNQLREIENDN